MTIESIIHDQWYPLAVTEDLANGASGHTHLLGQPISYRKDQQGQFSACSTTTPTRHYPTLTRHHTHWVCLGEPSAPLFPIPEFDEPDRRILGAGSMQVHASGLRVIENFLDMAHFPYVHTGLLGAEPHTDISPYQVKIEAGSDEIIATDCRIFQPLAAAAAKEGMEAHYVYRVTRPFCALLYKTSPEQPHRRDVICLFVQPLDEERCIAHVVLAYIDSTSSDRELRLFQQTIFGQDLMILSNHRPRGLPLDPRYEIPTRADALSSTYRRWLQGKGIRYGTYQAD